MSTLLRHLLVPSLLALVVAVPAADPHYGPYVSRPKAQPAQQPVEQPAESPSLEEQVAKAEPLPNRITTLSASPRTYDHRRLEGWNGPDAVRKARLDQAGVVLAQCPGDTGLANGLAALQIADPARFSFRETRMPSVGFLKNGGVARTLAGSRRKPETRIEDFANGLTRGDLGAEADLAMLGFHHDDISPGRSVEYVTTVYRVRLDIRSYKVSLGDVQTDQISAISNQNGALVGSNYPIELPNTEVAGLSTSVITPAGGGTATRHSLSPRFPGLAFAFYRDTMNALEKAYPGTQLAWSTVPPRERENLQANLFNTLVREHAAANGKLLFDAAAVLSHDPAGNLEQDAQGPVLAVSWRDPEGELNAAGAERLARCWWAMLDGTVQ